MPDGLSPEHLCPCGQPLHDPDPAAEAIMRDLVARLGPTVVVTVAGVGRWRVPRQFIALHGLTAAEWPALAERDGWERMDA